MQNLERTQIQRSIQGKKIHTHTTLKKKTAMKALPLELLVLVSLVILSSIIDISSGGKIPGIQISSTHVDVDDDDQSHRRILHQPLFPIDSTEPPPSVPSPPLESSDTPDQPFLPEVPPNGSTMDQSQPPPVPATSEAPTQQVPIAIQPSKPTKKVAIAISVGIVTMGMLSGLAFFLYRYRVKHPSVPTQRLGGRTEPMNRSSTGRNDVNEEGETESPYHKLNSLRSSELYRPSPELQPLPPLSRAAIRTSPPIVPLPNVAASRRTSSAVSSDDETLNSPQVFVKNGENTYMSVSRQVFPVNANPKGVTHTTGSSPQSRRSSPRSRLSVSSSPDVKLPIVPTPSSPSLPPLPLPPAQQARDQYDQPRTPSPTKRKAKFRSPPSPPPNLLLPLSGNDQPPRAAKIPVPPPPPPPPLPPLPPQTAKLLKIKPLEISPTPMPVRVLNIPQSNMASPKENTFVEVPVPVAEKTQGSHSDSLDVVEDEDGAKPKLKPLHWDKVRASSDRAMVWDQMKSSTFQLNEDMIETLFGCNNTNGIQKESTRKSVLPPVELDNKVLDPKKSQNIAILLRALNVTRDEVSDALLDGNPEGLGAELLETLVKMAPTKEEELKLRNYSGDITKLGTAERFLKAILEIPFAFTRVDAMLYRANFDTEVKYLRKSFETLEAACEELKKSRLFLKLLEAVLRTGNRMNVGTNRGEARAFKLDTLLKLVDVKGIDGKTTLLHFVVQEIIRSEGEDSDTKPENLSNQMQPKVKEDDFRKQGLQVVSGLSRELGSVKKAAGMDSDVLSSYVSKLETGLKKVRLVLQYEKPDTQGKKFFEAMKLFLNEAEEEILRIKGDEKRASSHVKEVTEYFHGDTTKEGAHPFRIFVIVRDFLTVLDQVCREVGKMHERTMMGVARSFRISATAPLPVLNRFNTRQDESSDED